MAAKVFLFVNLIAVITVEEGLKMQIRKKEKNSKNSNNKHKI